MRRKWLALKCHEAARPAELKRHKTERHTAAVGVREEVVLGAATPPDTVVRWPLRFKPRLQRGQDLPLLCETLDDDATHASALTFTVSRARRSCARRTPPCC